MIRIFSDKVYDTDNATMIFHRDFTTSFGELYFMDTGEIFLYLEYINGAKLIYVIGYGMVEMWALQLIDDKAFNIIFGDMPRNNYERLVERFTAYKDVIRYVDEEAQKMGVSFSEALEHMLSFSIDKYFSSCNAIAPDVCKDMTCARNHSIITIHPYSQSDGSMISRLIYIRRHIIDIIQNQIMHKVNLCWEDTIAYLVKIYETEN